MSDGTFQRNFAHRELGKKGRIELVKRGEYERAQEQYTLGLNFRIPPHVLHCEQAGYLYCNRALCFLKLKESTISRMPSKRGIGGQSRMRLWMISIRL